MQVKDRIFSVRHEMEKHDVLHINNLENRIKDLKLHIEQNEKEKASLKTIAKEQTIAVNQKTSQEVESRLHDNR